VIQIIALCFYTISELRDGEQGTRMLALLSFPIKLKGVRLGFELALIEN